MPCTGRPRAQASRPAMVLTAPPASARCNPLAVAVVDPDPPAETHPERSIARRPSPLAPVDPVSPVAGYVRAAAYPMFSRSPIYRPRRAVRYLALALMPVGVWFASLPRPSLRLGPDVTARDISLHLNLPPVELAQAVSASLRSSPSKQRDISTTRYDGPRTQFFVSGPAVDAPSVSPRTPPRRLASPLRCAPRTGRAERRCGLTSPWKRATSRHTIR